MAFPRHADHFFFSLFLSNFGPGQPRQGQARLALWRRLPRFFYPLANPAKGWPQAGLTPAFRPGLTLAYPGLAGFLMQGADINEDKRHKMQSFKTTDCTIKFYSATKKVIIQGSGSERMSKALSAYLMKAGEEKGSSSSIDNKSGCLGAHSDHSGQSIICRLLCLYPWIILK